ncbi:Doubled CXXCH motif (Paired_CXXCH_1) [Rubripirellula lacrimiformis]|uniref:Doubled CXXCH motif (Paired_CXXCH_1) n=1 Tax=Rubripirellula lacrimiformis TaxID=1930273 RepID=A0A517NA20_9BACT|nr:C cytochrome precursor [Rubripirellula lacrimiformis]QDT03980.1 Doubled CXXCH motif (Paired_CXXCH_1) [Rubripirellula lacrimiformis]
METETEREMFSRGKLILGVIILVAVGYALMRPAPDAGDQFESLRRRSVQRDTGALNQKAKNEIQRWNQNTLDGIGMPPPSDLAVSYIGDGDYWFVGKLRDGGGVEIPFAPGKMPRQPDEASDKNDVESQSLGYVGPDVCKRCHEKTHASFMQTAHSQTSKFVDQMAMPGQFEPPENRMSTSDANLSIEMIQLEDDYFQRVRFYDWYVDVPMQLSFGSGNLARTFGYWNDDRLYQHNVTHLTKSNRWINSPGFVDGDAAYARPIPARCMDCHATFFEPTEETKERSADEQAKWRSSGGGNEFDPHSLILGVSCERCHGPAAEHVAYHDRHPDATEPRHIVQPAALPRQRQLEICGQCHAGSTDLRSEPFTYRPGDNLLDHYYPAPEGSDGGNSVHTSNQLSRLQVSECFLGSDMTCVACHNPHENQREQTKAYSASCLECHQQQGCHFVPPDGITLSDDCVSCHMPSRPTSDLRLQSVVGDVFPILKDHYIRIDQQATTEFLERHSGSNEAEKQP